MAKKIPAEFQKAIDLMAESIEHMSVKGRTKETVKAGLRAAATYALMKRSGFVLGPLKAGTQRSI